MNEWDSVRQLLENKSITKIGLAKKLGRSRTTIDNWLKGETHPDINDLKDMSSILNTFNKALKKTEAQAPKKKRVPFYDIEAEGGLPGTDTSPVALASGTIDVGDLLIDSESAIRISGNSMMPNYPPGCVVGLIKRHDQFIEPGEVYVVDTRDGRILKRLFYKNDDSMSEYLTCYSDNIMNFQGGPRDGKLCYPPYEIHREHDIISIYTVVGVIKRNTNSMIVHKK